MGPKRIAGRYRVERAAGRGGMGTVWLCSDEVLGRQVAVKQVGTLPGEDALDLARALREARSLAALNHRNVVSVYDAVEEGDHIWLVMEYVPGRSLSELLAEQGPLPPEQVALVGAQVADGLAAAHARGTIHRDVKPGNILVTEDWTAKISDFGIARTPGDPEVTRSGMVTGTPAYFAPEVARGESPTPAADVWALGATLFAAVEGRSLFPERPNPLALLADIASRPPPQPQHAGFLTEPIVRALDPDPGSRWSMADLAHVLHRLGRRYAGDHTREVTAAFPAGPRVTAPTPLTEPPDAVVAAPEQEPDRPPVAAQARRRDRGGGLIAVGLAALLVLAAVGAFLLFRDLGSASQDDVANQGTSSNGPSADPSASPESGDVEGSEPENSVPEESVPESGTESSAPEQSPTSTASPVVGSEAEQFVTDYYAALPTDTRTGWASLSGDVRREVGGYGSYRGFWDTIDEVTVTDTASSGDGAVEVSLTYTRDDGSTAEETRRLEVERSGDGHLIVGDEVVG